jgi:cell division protein FtsI/penicillin-binding protein 2
VIIAVIVVALVAAGVPVGLIVLKHRREAAQRAAAASFAHAWMSGNLAGIGYSNATSATVAAAVQKVTAGVTTAAKDAPSEVTASSLKQVAGNGGAFTAGLKVTWTLSGGRVWRYPTSVTIVHTNGKWLPEYTIQVIHPKLTPGEVLQASTQQPTRGEIIGANDDPLVSERPVVVVGLERSRTSDVAASATQIGSITGVDGAALAKRVQAAAPDTFVAAITLRKDAYQKVRAQLQPIPGAVFQESTLSLGPTADFARALLGTVGPATADVVKSSKGRVQAGDITGLSGLQQAYDAQLSGSPGLVVQAIPASSSTGAAQPVTLFSANPVAGKPIHITLDRKIQIAAEDALKSAKKPAALVAIRPGTGEVLAVANGGPNASGYDRALLGQYPPGSTFKVASGLGLLTAGVTPQTRIKCPASIDIGGRKFANAEHEVLGSAPFHQDFADSCNTAFVGSSTRISIAQLAKAAHSLGYGQPNKLGITAFTGSVPSSGDAVAHAAAMIGQGTVLTSPVTVAGASAAVAAGRWTPPRLVLTAAASPTRSAASTDTTSTDTSTGTGTASDQPLAPDAAGIALPAGPIANLRSLMREVVLKGTGTGLKSTPGGPVSGKTGTAEYGSANPPRTHAWFTGFQGNLAFAVVVEDGGFGAKSAVPLVKNFLTRLAR